MGVLDMTSLPLWAVVLLSCLALYIAYMSSTFATFWKLGIPGPTPLPLFGNTLQMLRRGVIKNIAHDYIKYKSNKVYGTFEGRSPVMTFADKDMAREILVKQSNNFTNRPRYFALDQPGIDHIMFNTRDEYWKQSRSSLKPSLSPARLKLLYPVIETKLRNLISNMKEMVKKDNEIEITGVCASCAMDIVAHTAFNVDLDSFQIPEHKFVRASKSFLEVLFMRVFMFQHLAPRIVTDILNYLGITVLPRKALTTLRKYTKLALETRQTSPRVDADDVLQYLIDNSIFSDTPQAGRKRLDMEDIYGASITYLVAGFDTLSKGIFYSIFQLAMHPECFKKAQREVDEELQGEFPNPDNIQKLKYLDMCLKENMRLIPLAAYTDRECNKATTIGDVHVPKGMYVRIPITGFHHDPDVFPEPDRYDPDRFSPDQEKDRHPMAFLNFGAGPRSCFGESLAKLVVRCSMAAFLQAFDMVPCERSQFPVKLDPRSDIYPLGGLWLAVTHRK